MVKETKLAQGNNKVAAFFKTKRDGMFVGSVKPEQLENLISIIKDAKSQGLGIVFFFWKNEPGAKTVGALTAAVERPREQAAPAQYRRPIGQTEKPAPKNPIEGLFGGGARKATPPEDEGW